MLYNGDTVYRRNYCRYYIYCVSAPQTRSLAMELSSNSDGHGHTFISLIDPAHIPRFNIKLYPVFPNTVLYLENQHATTIERTTIQNLRHSLFPFINKTFLYQVS